MFASISYHFYSFEKSLDTKFESMDNKFESMDKDIKALEKKMDTKLESIDLKLNMISQQIKGNDDVKEMNKRVLQLEVDKAIRDYHSQKQQ